MLEERPQGKPASSLKSPWAVGQRSLGTTGQRDTRDVGGQAGLRGRLSHPSRGLQEAGLGRER